MKAQEFIRLNRHQQEAYRLMSRKYNEYIWGLENLMQDSPEDSEDYKSAKADLENTEMLINTIYSETMREAEKSSYKNHIRFAGKDWLINQIIKKLEREGLAE